MTDAHQDFIERWRREEPVFLAWGRFVARELSRLIEGKVAPTELKLFLRLPVEPRVKTEISLVQKAFYRQKNYQDPYKQIEDKVGLRFVVLLVEDIKIIEQAIMNGTQFWEAEKARDFHDERLQKPFEFDYQSLHYIVTAKYGCSFEGIDIFEGAPCEIQVRTLLQHAYSELTHDTIYKPSIAATPHMKRAAAKSMALIEATDDYFTHVASLIDQAAASHRSIASAVADRYGQLIDSNPLDSPLNSILIDHYRQFVTDAFPGMLQELLDSKTFIVTNIKARLASSQLYRVPAILLVYFCVSEAPQRAKHESPLSDDELSQIYADFGLSLS